jgi:O-antigen/teichoic acid export membrane protein
MILRNTVSNGIGLALLAAISFLLTPILIHGLGQFYFGLWVLVSSVVGYYGLFDIGLRTTMQRYVARLRGMNDHEALNQTFTTALVLTLGISCFLIVLSIALASFLPAFFNLRGISIAIARSLFLLMGLEVAVSLPAMLIGSYLCGWQRFDLFNINAVAVSAVQAALFIFVLRFGFGVLGVAGVTLGVTTLSIPFQWWLVRRIDTQLHVRWRNTSWNRARELVSFSFSVFFGVIGFQLRAYTDAIVIARVLGLAMVTPFTVASRLIEYSRRIIVAATSPLLPAFSELDGQGRQEEVRALFLRSTRMTVLISLFASLILILHGKSLLRIWVGKEFISSYSLLVILVAGNFLAFVQRPARLLLIAAGHQRFLGLIAISDGLANLALSIFWARRYGLVGVALGTTVPLLVSTVIILCWYVLRVTTVRFGEHFRSALARPLLAGAIFALIGYAVHQMFPAPGLLSFLGILAGETTLFALLAYFPGLIRSERHAIWEWKRSAAASLASVRIL